VETALLFACAVLAFPAPWRRRIAGLLLGFAAIQLLNLVRVVSLFWIGAHKPALFSSSHTVLWQSAVVLCGVLLFLFYASLEQRRRSLAAKDHVSQEKSG
jgi:exosortase/archaeosortase family protein